MTTIAYRDGVLASDSLAVSGLSFEGWVVKTRKRGPYLAACSGDAANGTRFLDWFSSGCLGEPPKSPRDNDGCWGCVFCPDGLILKWEGDGWIMPLRAPFFAIGSGAPYAEGAMAMGADAVRAVRVAIELDRASGGAVRALDHHK